MSDIRIVKLVTGDEVIAKTIKDSAGVVSYLKPRVFQVVQGSNGRPTAALIPFFISAPDETVAINPKTIVASVVASKQIEDEYLRHTSGIEIATSL